MLINVLPLISIFTFVQALWLLKLSNLSPRLLPHLPLILLCLDALVANYRLVIFRYFSLFIGFFL